MAQILPQNDLGAQLGRGLGQGISGSLDYLINKKLGDIKQRHQVKGLEALGISPDQARALASLDPQTAQFFIKQHLAAPGERALAESLAAGYGNQNPMQQFAQSQGVAPEILSQQTQISPQALMALQALGGQETPQLIAGNDALNQFMTQPTQNAWENALAGYAREQMQQPQQPMMTKQPLADQGRQPELKPSERMRAALAGKQLNQQQTRFLMDQIRHAETLEARKEEQERKHGIAGQKLSAAEYKDIQQANKPYYSQIRSKADAAEYSDKLLDRMTKLIDKGNLPYSVLHSTADSIGKHLGKIVGGLGGALIGATGGPGGILAGASVGASALKDIKADITALESKDAQEFSKLTLEFMTKMKDIFGGQIPVQEMETFLRSVPNLSQSDEGKRAVIRNMKLTGEGWKIRNKVMNDIIKRNNGRQPRNLDLLVEEEAGPQLKKLATQFVEGY